ncbi:glycoside hydrolase superfamily [Chytriomyces sp. MP71]|nr:glycoside hydrolase superfamily [Chytriomyces sp. MP71]
MMFTPLTSAILLTRIVAAAPTSPTFSLYEPKDGKIMFGAWVDSEDPKASGNIGLGGDSPVAFNNRLGQNASVFHMSQSIPLAISPFDGTEMTVPLNLIEDTKTDAILFLTLYPNQTATNSWDLIKDSDLLKLAYQLDNITHPTKSARRVLVRYAPEFNGNWFAYGQQPTRFIKEWIRLVTAVRSVTKRVGFVWSPNAGNNYPFGDNFLPNYELATLDTNGDGALTIMDDPFTPYYPGDDFVDWFGMSVYWKGDPTTQYPLHDNSVPPANYWEQIVQNTDATGNPAFPFYSMFPQKHNKPLVMSEGGSAFALTQQGDNTPLAAGVGQVAFEQGFWQSYLNTDFFAKFPKAKMFINFEFEKVHEDPAPGQANGITRDYRITQNPDVLAAFRADIKALSTSMQWSAHFSSGLDPLSIGGGTSSAFGNANSAGGATNGLGGSTASGSGINGDVASDTSSDGSSSSSTSKTGAIAGGVIGGLIVVVGAGGIINYFMNKRKEEQEEAERVRLQSEMEKAEAAAAATSTPAVSDTDTGASESQQFLSASS